MITTAVKNQNLNGANNTVKKALEVNISEITTDIYVRKELNEDRIYYWAEKFENDPDSVEPIEIAQDKTTTDGRHRLAAADLVGRTTIKSIIVPVKNKAEQLARAFLANVTDGPLPPSKADIVMTIKQMIDQKMSQKDISAVISKSYPLASVKKFYDEARHGIYRDKLSAAKRDVHESICTPVQAAEKYGVELDTLKKELGGKKTKGKVNAAELKKLLSTQFRSQGQKMSKILRNAQDTYDSGDMTKPQMVEVFDYFADYLKRQQKNLNDQRARFNTKI